MIYLTLAFRIWDRYHIERILGRGEPLFETEVWLAWRWQRSDITAYRVYGRSVSFDSVLNDLLTGIAATGVSAHGHVDRSQGLLASSEMSKAVAIHNGLFAFSGHVLYPHLEREAYAVVGDTYDEARAILDACESDG